MATGLGQVRLVLRCGDMRLGLIRLVVGGLLLIVCEIARWRPVQTCHRKGAAAALWLTSTQIQGLSRGSSLSNSRLVTAKTFILFAAAAQTACINPGLLRVRSFPPLAPAYCHACILEAFIHAR
jgi:hypothetical protein